jgi:hypothetical protein
MVGHKFPSGVGFRRAFIAFSVLDQNGETLWASDRTNGAGVIVDEHGEPIDSELWWKDDCSARIRPGERPHQPYFQSISRQNQAQIYQELVSTPPANLATPVCGGDAVPSGELTTSFLSICAKVKGNRILPTGTLPLDARRAIAKALGAGDDLAEDAGAVGVGDDPDYVTGGGDSLTYRVPIAQPLCRPFSTIKRCRRSTCRTASAPPRAAMPNDLVSSPAHLNLAGTQAEGWKLKVVSSGTVPIATR